MKIYAKVNIDHIPECCLICPLANNSNVFSCNLPFTGSKWKKHTKETRQKGCPLVEVEENND